MKKNLLAVLLLALVATCAFGRNGNGSSKFTEGYYKFDNAIRRFLMGGLDTTYVDVPATSFEVPVITNIYGYKTGITVDGKRLDLNTGACFEVGAGIGYHGLDAVYTQAVGKNRMTFNFAFDYYDNYWGLGIIIGREKYGKEIYGEPSDGNTEFESRTITLNGYVALFGNRYSYPASVYGNYIQKKSAGSPLLFFWYDRYDYYAHTQRFADILAANGKSNLNEGAITAGYGHNFAIAKGRVVLNVHAGVGILLPSAGLATNGRFGGIAWLSDNFRLTFSIMNLYQKSWREKDLYLEDNLWRAQIGFAYCFGKNPHWK